MTVIVGNKKQEAKIAELAQMAQEMLPGPGVLAYKGCFRRGAAKALDEVGVADWAQVAEWPPARRGAFFDKLVEHAGGCLGGLGLDPAEVARLVAALRKANQRYLKS